MRREERSNASSPPSPRLQARPLFVYELFVLSNPFETYQNNDIIESSTNELELKPSSSSPSVLHLFIRKRVKSKRNRDDISSYSTKDVKQETRYSHLSPTPGNSFKIASISLNSSSVKVTFAASTFSSVLLMCEEPGMGMILSESLRR